MRVIFLPETDHVSLVASNAVHFPPWTVAGQKLLNLEQKWNILMKSAKAIVHELECIPNWESQLYLSSF